MMIDIIVPKIFDKNRIVSGVTKRNTVNFPPDGFTINNSNITDDDTVQFNRKLLAKELAYDISNMAFQKQTHSNIVRIIDANNQTIELSDGMITSKKNIIINISIADCTAVLMYDFKNEVICGVHSGWRGTQQNITKIAIDKLSSEFGTKPRDLLVYLSPSASGEKYEVNDDVAVHFPRSIKSISGTKFLFDNKREIVFQLLDCGVKLENIEISEYCTISNTDFHSYRRDADVSGRMSAFIGMKI
jgi:YfiH family protein